MAVDLNLEQVPSGYNLTKINSNFNKIQTAFDDVLGLSGDIPNAMLTDFDLNGNDVLNGGVANFQSGFFNGVAVENLVGQIGPAGAAATVAIGSTTTLSPGSPATAVNVGTTAAAVINFGIPRGADGAGAGSVTSVSVVSANGFAGSVATATSTPAITISTTVTGVLKGNGTSVVAATAGTDFYAPGSTDVAVADGGTGSSTAGGARTNLGLGTTDNPQFATIELGSATDTTISRSAAGVIAVEGVPIFSNMPQNSQSTAYTTILADAQKHILHPTADNNARTFTIDSNANVAYPIGTAITFVNQINTVTISITTDTMVLAGAGTTGSRTLAANGIATALKIASTTWMISGAGLT